MRNLPQGSVLMREITQRSSQLRELTHRIWSLGLRRFCSTRHVHLKPKTSEKRFSQGLSQLERSQGVLQSFKWMVIILSEANWYFFHWCRGHSEKPRVFVNYMKSPCELYFINRTTKVRWLHISFFGLLNIFSLPWGELLTTCRKTFPFRCCWQGTRGSDGAGGWDGYCFQPNTGLILQPLHQRKHGNLKTYI